MGISTSGIAIKSDDKAAVLNALRYQDTGQPCPLERLPVGGQRKQVITVLPDGWIYLLGDFSKLDERRLKAASLLGPVVTCSLVTTVDASQARAFSEGAELWFVNRDPDGYPEYDPHQLEVRGEPPVVFQSLCDLYFPIVGDPESEEDEGDIFEIPLELAKSVCGFRPDYVIEVDGTFAPFTYLKRAADPKPTTPFLKRLWDGVGMARRAVAASRAARR